MTSGGSSYGGATYGSTTTQNTQNATPTEWRATVDGTTREDALYDVEVEDTANPFGDYAVLKIDDSEGKRFERYARGTRIDVEVSPSDASYFVPKFTGYVVERRELEESGADALEVEAYSFDQFLRNNTVSNDQSGKAVVDALEDIIKTDTPVTWDASNVTVGDSQELTRSYRGEPVEETLRDIAFKSESEDFGVNDSLEFFFQPREEQHIDRGIDNTQWFNYDIPELGKEVRNEVEVWFDDGNRSVIVDDGQDKLDLQDSLGLQDPGTQRAEINRPDITDISDAEDEGRKYLQFRNSTLSGTVVTFGLFDAEPGDTIDITIDERGIDGEFRLAALNYQWGRDETTLTIVEKRGEQDEVLFRLAGSIKRQEMADADRDAPSNRITTTRAGAEIAVSVDADGNTPDAVKVVNDGRNAVRDGWIGDGNPTIDTIAVGDNGSGLSRSNSDLRNQTNSASASETLNGTKGVTYDASITQTGVEEIGLKTASGTLISRVVFDDPVDLGGTVNYSLTVSNDDEYDRSVLTDTGQETVRDILADNAPNIPEKYAYGSGTTDPTESDTSLARQETTQDLDRILLRSVNTSGGWLAVTPEFDDTTPLKVSTSPDELTQLQTTLLIEAEDAGGINGTVVGNDATSYGILSNDEGVELTQAGDWVDIGLIPEYDIPNGEATADHYYSSDSFDGKIRLVVNGVEVDTISYSGVSNSNQLSGSPFINQTLNSGEVIDFRVRCTEHNSGTYIVDTMQIVDTGDRTGNRWVTRSGSFDSNTATYDAPELYPDLQEVRLDTFETTRDITEGEVQSTWNDTSNNQFIELSNDGGSTWIRTNNSDTATATFANPNSNLDVNLGLSRYTVDSTTTPSQGDATHTVDDLEAFADPKAVVTDGNGISFIRAVIPSGTVTGVDISEAALYDTNDTTLTRHVFAESVIEQGQQLISAETTTVEGAE